MSNGIPPPHRFGGPLVVAGLIGAVLGFFFALISLEGADDAAPSYATGSFVYLVAVPLAWAVIGGAAFAPWTQYPPYRRTAARLAFEGAARGAAAGELGLAAAALAWIALGLTGTLHAGLMGLVGVDTAQWFGVIVTACVVGVLLGVPYSVVAGRYLE